MIKNISLPATLGISSGTKLCAVIGNPISHSLSPLIHNRWYHDHSINAVYLAFPVEIGKVKEIISTLHNIGARGANITLPHKVEALQACDSFTERVKKIGATNSILFRESEVIGDNTDSEGFARDLRVNQRLNFPSQKFFNKACLWGAGGAAQAVLYALLTLQVKEILVINRTLDKARGMIGGVERGKSFFSFRVVSSCRAVSSWEMEKKFVADCDLFVNATSLGMKAQKNKENSQIKNSQNENFKIKRGTGQTQKLEQEQERKQELELEQEQKQFFPDFSEIVKKPEQALAYDLVYNPIETEFLKSAKKANMKCAGGIGMLVAQAAISFEDWFGINPINSQKNYSALIKQLTEHISKT